MKTKTILKERIRKKEKIKLIKHKMNTMLKVKVMMTLKKITMTTKMITTRTQTRMIQMKVMIARKMRMNQIG